MKRNYSLQPGLGEIPKLHINKDETVEPLKYKPLINDLMTLNSNHKLQVHVTAQVDSRVEHV